MELQPTTVTLPLGSGQTGTALVVVHNQGATALHDLKLSWLPSPSLDVTSKPDLSLPTLAPHSDYLWTLTVKASHGVKTAGGATSASSGDNATPEQTRVDDTLSLKLDYRSEAGGNAANLVLLKSLPVKTQDLSDYDKSIGVEIKSALDSLDSSRSGSIYVVLKNNSARTVSVNSIKPIGKDNLSCEQKPDADKQKPQTLQQHPAAAAELEEPFPICVYAGKYPVLLSPYQQATQELRVKALNRVEPGKYMIVLDVQTQAYEGGVPLVRDIVISQPIEVGVLGGSEILKALGIPSFFLMPGALFMLSFAFFFQRKWWRPAGDASEYSIKFNDPDFWIVSVTLSLIVAFGFRLFSGRWYFTRYSLQDVALLWFLSIVCGGIFYWAVMQWHAHEIKDAAQKQRAADALSAAEAAAKTPLEDDQPIEAMHKLLLRGGRTILLRTVAVAGSHEPGFALMGEESDVLNTCWICPYISLNFADSPIEIEVTAALKKKVGLEEMIRLLNRKGVTLAWANEPYDKPRQIKKTEIAGWNDLQVFLRSS